MSLLFFNKFLLIGGGLAVAGTGTGLGVYYGAESKNERSGQNQRREENNLTLGKTRETFEGVSIPRNTEDRPPKPALRSQ